MRQVYDITVTGYGHAETYWGLERQVHDEMYVEAIDRFLNELKKLNIKTHNDNWTVLSNLICKHNKRFI